MITAFRRFEKKYILSHDQFHNIKEIMAKNLKPDDYGEYMVQSIYFDTEGWDVIRTSVEKPLFKEKVRLRCYNVPDHESNMFLESKKKFNGFINKRRIVFPLSTLHEKNVRQILEEDTTQIGRELEYYFRINDVRERAHISYNRLAFAGEKGFRVTFDSDIRFRADQLDYDNPKGGLEVIDDGRVLMEVKTHGDSGIPFEISRAINNFQVYPISFSKIGKSYQRYIVGEGGENNA